MTETNFFQSWAFWLLAGIVIGFIAGFALAIIMAASGRASRMEEKMVYDAYEKEKRRRDKPDIMAVKQNDPRTD